MISDYKNKHSSKAPSDLMIRSTEIMEKCLKIFKVIKVMPISNPSGVTTDLYTHFFKEDENARLERDSRTVQVIRYGVTREILQRYIPKAVDTPENLLYIQEFKTLANQYIDLAEKAIRPIYCLCLPKKRTNCGCCFKSLFGDSE